MHIASSAHNILVRDLHWQPPFMTSMCPLVWNSTISSSANWACNAIPFPSSTLIFFTSRVHSECVGQLSLTSESPSHLANETSSPCSDAGIIFGTGQQNIEKGGLFWGQVQILASPDGRACAFKNVKRLQRTLFLGQSKPEQKTHAWEGAALPSGRSCVLPHISFNLWPLTMSLLCSLEAASSASARSLKVTKAKSSALYLSHALYIAKWCKLYGDVLCRDLWDHIACTTELMLRKTGSEIRWLARHKDSLIIFMHHFSRVLNLCIHSM